MTFRHANKQIKALTHAYKKGDTFTNNKNLNVQHDFLVSLLFFKIYKLIECFCN